MATLADVAAHAGVSKATASRALNRRGYVSDTTHHRVEAAASELSFVAHPGLRVWQEAERATSEL